MPEGRFANVVILAEDWAQARFMKRWIQRYIDIDSRNITTNFRSEGAGEQFVRTQFQKELTGHRGRVARLGVLLLAVIDADTGTCAARHQQMTHGETLPSGVFVFIPKRNIESWLHVLSRNKCDEEQCYKHEYSRDPGKLGPLLDDAADEFLRLVQNREPAALPSLHAAVLEARRVPREHVPPLRRK